MQIIEYYTPTHVYFGKGAEEKIADVLKGEGASHVMLHFGTGSVKKSGLLDKIEKLLDDAGIKWTEFGGVVPNPRLTLVEEGVRLVKQQNIDYIVAVGGGSTLDSAKAIGYGVYDGGNIWDFYTGKRAIKGTMPIGSILTLSATGSEMSDSSVITNDQVDPIYKHGVSSDFGKIRFALLNPELTYTVSKYQTASGSTDIMMHTLERFFHSGYTLDLTDELSYSLLRTVMKYAPIAIKDPENYEARANLMWAGSISHNGLMNVGNPGKGDWACHQIEHELSAEFDVAHGAGLASVWSSWARYVNSVNPDRFIALGQNLFNVNTVQETIESMEKFFHSIDMPTNTRELGLDMDDEACMLAARRVSLEDQRTIGDFKVLKTDDIYHIYKMAAGLE